MLKLRRLSASKCAMKYDPHLINYVLLLRFGTCSDIETAKPVMNYASISKLIKVPVTTVIELVKTGIVMYYSLLLSSSMSTTATRRTRV